MNEFIVEVKEDLETHFKTAIKAFDPSVKIEPLNPNFKISTVLTIEDVKGLSSVKHADFKDKIEIPNHYSQKAVMLSIQDIAKYINFVSSAHSNAWEKVLIIKDLDGENCDDFINIDQFSWELSANPWDTRKDDQFACMYGSPIFNIFHDSVKHSPKYFTSTIEFYAEYHSSKSVDDYNI